MARKFFITERKDTPEQQHKADELHRWTNAYRYTNDVGSEFNALYEIVRKYTESLSKKRGKEKEKRAEKEVSGVA